MVFNLDLIAHNGDLKRIEKLYSFLEGVGYDGIRVRDLGLAKWLESGKLWIELDSGASYKTREALDFLEEHLGAGLRTLVLSRELEYARLESILCGGRRDGSKGRKGWKGRKERRLKTELLVHGPILLFYSRRRLLKEQGLVEEDGSGGYEVYLEEKKRIGERYRFRDNEHGSFMFFYQELSLYGEVQKLRGLGLDYWLFDFRGKGLECIEGVKGLFENGNGNDGEERSIIEGLGGYYVGGTTKGFFKGDLTDVLRKGKGKEEGKEEGVVDGMNEKKEYKELIGRVIGVVKGKTVAIEVLGVVVLGEEVWVEGGKGKEGMVYEIKEMRDLSGKEDIRGSKGGQVVITRWKKGITTGNMIYRLN